MKYHFDEERANHAVDWIEEYCTYPDGPMAGQPLELLPYFRKIIRDAFGWVDENGDLKHMFIYTEVPRGNAKTVNGACIALYMAFGFPDKSRRVYMCAGSREQATEMFDPAKDMAEGDDDLNRILKVTPAYKRITDRETGSYIKAVAAEGFRQHGKKTNACMFDELHVQPNSNLWDAMKTSLTKKRNSMMWVFTTAGMTGTFAEEVHNYAIKIRDGLTVDDSWLVNIWGATPDDDPFDPAVWERVNPAWNIINHKAFASVAKTAEQHPKELNAFKRYHLNMWTGAESAFLSIYDWDNCADVGVSIDDMAGLKMYAGLDYGSSRDLTAYARFFPVQDGLDHPVVFVDFFCPEDTVYEREVSENVNYEVWVDAGLVIPTAGNFVNKDHIYDHIVADLEKYDWQCIGIDPAKTDTLRARLLQRYDDLDDQRLVRRTRQGEWLSSAIDELESMVVNHELRHDGNPVMRWQCDNLAVQESRTSSRKRVIKRDGNTHNKIDGFSALLNCIYEFLEDERERDEGLSDMYTTIM